MHEKGLSDTILSRTESNRVAAGTFHMLKRVVVSIGQGQTHRRTAR